MIRVLVTGRYTENNGRAGFIGTSLSRHDNEGSGGWGYDDEIREVERA